MSPIPIRRMIRLPRFDYGSAGAYFITVCAYNRQHLFGTIRNGTMCLNDLGALVWKAWTRSFDMRPNFSSHAFIVMPNHWHGLFSITRPEGDVWNEGRIAAFGKPAKDTTATMAGGIKSSVTSRARKEWGMTDKIWQPRFYDHVVRDEADFLRIADYILTNPNKWNEDRFYTP